ncbi:MAG TPA: fatty acid desaturase [Pyrinomonadaceae bacterium]|nr:fatty acid desaturase [Pyrinomonadaceae bacterium]
MTTKVIKFETPSSRKIHWDTIVFVAIFHLLAGYAIYLINWPSVAAFMLTWWISGSLGIGLGYHRLLTHKGFKTPRWLMRTLATFGALALQSGPIAWVTTHRLHHAFTDTDRDPHSPRNGVFWSHIGWIFKGTAQIQPQAVVEKYSPDLLKDRYLVALEKYYYVPTVIVGLAAFLIGGLPMLLGAVFLRTVVLWHFTWLVNSATHLWGSRRFDVRDDSRNNALVAAVTFGEGWHNNHHAIPRSARHGLTWREFDINWIQIKTLEKLGLATDIYAYDLNDESNTEAIKMAA